MADETTASRKFSSSARGTKFVIDATAAGGAKLTAAAGSTKAVTNTSCIVDQVRWAEDCNETNRGREKSELQRT